MSSSSSSCGSNSMSVIFSARTFTVLLYCIFLSWHSCWFSRPAASLGDDITSQELYQLVQADSKHSIFRSSSDLVAFLAEPGQYSQPFHLLIFMNLRTASFYEDKQGLRHILSRQDVTVSLAKRFLPTLLAEASYPLFAGDFLPFTLLQTEAPHGSSTVGSEATNGSDSSRSGKNQFGYTSMLLMRFRSRRNFVDWLLGVYRQLESGQLQSDLEYPLRAYRSLLAGGRGDEGRSDAYSSDSGEKDADAVVLISAVPLSGSTSFVLERMVEALTPLLLLGTYHLLASFKRVLL